jgi:hypothetical protein
MCPGSTRSGQCATKNRSFPTSSRAERREPLVDALRRADRRRGLEHHHRARRDHGRDRLGGGVDVADVRRVVLAERSGDRDDEHVGGLRSQRGAQVPGRDGGLHEDVELGLLHVDAARVDRGDDVGVHVDAQHTMAFRREQARGGKADVPESDDADVPRVQARSRCLWWSPLSGDRRGCRRSVSRPPWILRAGVARRPRIDGVRASTRSPLPAARSILVHRGSVGPGPASDRRTRADPLDGPAGGAQVLRPRVSGLRVGGAEVKVFVRIGYSAVFVAACQGGGDRPRQRLGQQ